MKHCPVMVIVVEPSTASASIVKPSPPCPPANAKGIPATSIMLAKIVSVCFELITGRSTEYVYINNLIQSISIFYLFSFRNIRIASK